MSAGDVPVCDHGQREGECASCASCAACDGSCGTCPYVPVPAVPAEPVQVSQLSTDREALAETVMDALCRCEINVPRDRSEILVSAQSLAAPVVDAVLAAGWQRVPDGHVTVNAEDLEEALEMLPYVDDYFREKWGYDKVCARLRAALPTEPSAKEDT